MKKGGYGGGHNANRIEFCQFELNQINNTNKWIDKFLTLTKEKIEHTEKGLVFLYHKA